MVHTNCNTEHKGRVVAFEHKDVKYVHFVQPIHSGMPSHRGKIRVECLPSHFMSFWGRDLGRQSS